MLVRVASRCARLHGCSLGAAASRSLSSGTAERKPLLQSVSLEQLAHKSKVFLEVPAATRSIVRISPTLQQSDFSLKVYGEGSSDDIFTVAHGATQDSSAPVCRINGESTSSSEIEVHLELPHLVDLDVVAGHGTIHLVDKFEGNVRVALNEGDITVSKVRGEQIELKTGRGKIEVISLIEGSNVKLASSAVQVKRLMSGTAVIKIGKGDHDSELGAIYSSQCLVNSQSSGELNVGNIHGFLRVHGDGIKAVNIQSVNGALHLEDIGAHCNVDAHFDGWSTDAANKIFVGGNVRVSLDPSAPIDVEMHGNNLKTDGCKFSESELDQLDDEYAIFSGSVAPIADSTSSASSGKINVGSAKNAALRTSFFAVDSGNSGDNTVSPSEDIHPARLPRLVVHSSSGNVSLEQLDWMAKIKRKHIKE